MYTATGLGGRDGESYFFYAWASPIDPPNSGYPIAIDPENSEQEAQFRLK